MTNSLDTSTFNLNEGWIPLQSSWRYVKDPKFKGLSIAAMMELNVPNGCIVLADSTWNKEHLEKSISAVLNWIQKMEKRELGDLDAHGIPLMISIRFGDKYVDRRKPISVSFIGTEIDKFSQEKNLQLKAFLDQLGCCDKFKQLSILSPIVLVTEIVKLGFNRLAKLALDERHILIQRTVCSFGLTKSGHGTAYTRHPQTGEELDYGRYMWNASGHQFDILSGHPKKQNLEQLQFDMPSAYWSLKSIFAFLEAYFEDTCFIEFCIEKGQVRIVQVTFRKRVCGTWKAPCRQLPKNWQGKTISELFLRQNDWDWQTTLNFSGLELKLVSNNPKDAEQAIKGLRFLSGHPAQLEDERWVINWIDDDGPTFKAGSGEPINIVRSSTGVHKLGILYEVGAVELVHIPRDRVVIAIESSERRIRILGRSSKNNGGSYYFKEAVRGLWRERLESEGWQILHAASIVVNGSAWLIVGNKGSGKSTLQLAFLHLGLHFLSADRTLVQLKKGLGWAMGWPGGMRLFPDTLDRFPLLAKQFDNYLSKVSPGTKKRRLTYSQLPVALSSMQTGSLPLGGYIFLNRDCQATNWKMHEIESKEAVKLISSHIFNNNNDLRKRWLRCERWWTKHESLVIPEARSFIFTGGGDPLDAAKLFLKAIDTNEYFK